MRRNTWTSKGFTLLELLVSLGIFSVVSVIMYSTFTSITAATSKVSDSQNLSDKAQRIVSFIEEDLRMVGYIVGPDAQIPYCNTVSPVVTYTSANPYDSITFLTAIPIPILEKTDSSCMTVQKDCANNPRADYFLTTMLCPSSGVAASVDVDAGAGCYDEIVAATGASDNAKSLVTFESLRMTTTPVSGSAPQSYYTVSSLGIILGFSEALLQTIPDNSTVYGVRRYRYEVAAGTRTLQRVSWKSNCATDPVPLLENASNSGGIDALKFEFTWLNSVTKTLETSYSLPPSFTDLKFITIWALVRSDRITQELAQVDKDQTYTLGSAGNGGRITVGPYADNYRRKLVHKSVEVKNLAPIF